MANKLSTDEKVSAVGMLSEGNSIRSVERMTGIHRDTIMRLGVRMGEGCQRIMDEKMRDLSCN
jgi:transposase-like protein